MFHRAEGREEKSECEAGSLAKRWLVKNGEVSCWAPAEPGLNGALNPISETYKLSLGVRRSAGWQPAVSPADSRRTALLLDASEIVRGFRRLPTCETAGCQPALRAGNIEPTSEFGWSGSSGRVWQVVSGRLLVIPFSPRDCAIPRPNTVPLRTANGITPKNHPIQDREARKAKLGARGRIGHPGEHHKLFCIQRLIQPAAVKHVGQVDSDQLLVLGHARSGGHRFRVQSRPGHTHRGTQSLLVTGPVASNLPSEPLKGARKMPGEKLETWQCLRLLPEL